MTIMAYNPIIPNMDSPWERQFLPSRERYAYGYGKGAAARDIRTLIGRTGDNPFPPNSPEGRGWDDGYNGKESD